MSLYMKNRIATALAILLCSLPAPMAQAQDLILPKVGTDPVILRVSDGIPDPEMLQVTLHGADTPIAGRYEFSADTIRFTPAFGFDSGRDYVVRLPQENEAVSFRIATDTAQLAPSVTHIYPSGDTLPENTLRFYIHFSVPMQPHVGFDYIQLRDVNGVFDDAAFMRFKQELWNEDRTRLTVLIDPGRIKRDVATNIDLGPALLAGQRYSLVIESGWPTADGSSFLPAFEKSFQVTDALRSRPSAQLWTTNTPCAGTREPLVVAFDRPFDRHLLANQVQVVAETDGRVDGSSQVEAGENAMRFTPSHPWPVHGLKVIANPTLEDVAGNNFRDLLDHSFETQENETSPTEHSVLISSC